MGQGQPTRLVRDEASSMFDERIPELTVVPEITACAEMLRSGDGHAGGG